MLFFFFFFLKALWRGYRVRRGVSSVKVKKARKRIKSANAAATESMKLCNRTRSALDFLLQCKNISKIVGALGNLGEFLEKKIITILKPNHSKTKTWQEAKWYRNKISEKGVNFKRVSLKKRFNRFLFCIWLRVTRLFTTNCSSN